MKRTTSLLLLWSAGCIVQAPDDKEVPTASALGCTQGQVVKWTGSAWSCAADAIGEPIDPGPRDAPSAAALGCTSGQVVQSTGAGWACLTLPSPDYSGFGQCDGAMLVRGVGADGHVLCASPPTVDEAAVDGFVANNGYAAADDVTAVSGRADLAVMRATDLETRVAALEAQLRNAALCPTLATRTGGVRAYTANTAAPAGVVRCTSGGDELVKVGDFWIDRYEAVAVDEAAWAGGACNVGAGTRYRSDGVGVDYPSGFEDGGRWSTPVYACSTRNVVPSRDLTWFQAQQACALAGKHLCTNAEWTAAASGTPDPLAPSDGTGGGACHTQSAANAPRASASAGTTPGAAGTCVSVWGAEDLIGNLWEWVGDWEAGTNTAATASPTGQLLAIDRGLDVVFDLMGHSFDVEGAAIDYPAGARRGGGYNSGTGAGIYALSVTHEPWRTTPYTGFRCCVGAR